MSDSSFVGRRAFLLFLLALSAAAALVLGASAALGRSPKLIAGDGCAYYSWLPTLFIDHDLDFRNNLRALYAPDSAAGQYLPTPRGTVATKCPIGLALMEFPVFAVAHLFARTAGAPADGVSMPYQVAVAAWLAGVFLLGLRAFHLALRVRGVGEPVAFLFAAMIVPGTNLLHYLLKEPSMPHAANVALIGFLAYLGAFGARDRLMDLGLGMLIGLLLVTRNSTAALLPWIAMYLAPARRSAGGWTLMALGALALLAANYAAVYLMWGRLTFRTYADEGFTGGLAGLLGSLFGVRHGLFVFHPWYLVLLALTAAGAVRMREHRPLFISALLSFALLWIFNGTWWCWWFGTSFGNRAFIESLPMLTFCAALFVSREWPGWTRRTRACLCAGSALLVLVNLYLWAGFLLGRYDRDGAHTWGELLFWAL